MDYLEKIEKLIERLAIEIKYFMLFPTCISRRKIGWYFEFLKDSASSFVVSKINHLINKVLVPLRKIKFFFRRIYSKVAFEVKGVIYTFLDLITFEPRKRKEENYLSSNRFTLILESLGRKARKVLDKVNDFITNIGYVVIEFMDSKVDFIFSYLESKYVLVLERIENTKIFRRVLEYYSTFEESLLHISNEVKKVALASKKYYVASVALIRNGYEVALENVRRLEKTISYDLKYIKINLSLKLSKVKEEYEKLKIKARIKLEYTKYYIEEKTRFRREKRKRLFNILCAVARTKEGQKIATSFVAMFFCVTVLIVGATSFTWLSNIGLVSTKANGINADKLYNYPNISMWTYTDSTKGEGDTSLWEESEASSFATNSPIMVVDKAESSSGEFVTKSLHFGTIDNLVNIRKDNVVYLTFEVTPKEVGDGITINIKEAEKEISGGNTRYPFTFYDQFGQEVPTTSPIYEDIEGVIEGENGNRNALFDFEYFVSTTEIEDPSLFNDEDFSEISTTSHEIVYASETEDTFYVYIKITPVLNSFARMVAHLTEIMPCVFLYDFDISYYINAN